MKMTEQEIKEHIAQMTGEDVEDIEPLKNPHGCEQSETIEQTPEYVIWREYWVYYHRHWDYHGNVKEITVDFYLVEKCAAIESDDEGEYSGDNEILYYEI